MIMRAILICPSSRLRSEFEAAAHVCHGILNITKSLEAYPSEAAFSKIVRAWAPQVVFFSMEDLVNVEILSRQAAREFPGLQQVALHSDQNSETFRRALQLRLIELLAPPFDPSELKILLARMSEDLERHPVQIGSTDRLFAFLPAKSGVGTSTIAANLTWALAKKPETRVLLADCDLHSGACSFLFNVEHEYSLTDAVARSNSLDEVAWQKLVKSQGNIDLLLSGAPRLPEPFRPQQVSDLLEFARRNYSVINVDLPDALDDVTLAVLREANRIFLTATPELPALRLARLKALVLRKLDLEAKASLLVNRFSKRTELSVEEIETAVGLPVVATFPCDYEGVTKASLQGRAAPSLAASLADFAGSLLDQKTEPKRSRFIERFALVPLRYRFF